MQLSDAVSRFRNMYVLDDADMTMKTVIDERMRCLRKLVDSGYQESRAYVELARALMKSMMERDLSHTEQTVA